MSDSELGAFRAVVQRLISRAQPSRGDDLLGMEIDFDYYLSASPLLTEVDVRSTDDPSRLILATCRAQAGSTREAVSAELERLWSECLGYDYWEAHFLVQDPNHVRFYFATQMGPDELSDADFFVTGRVQVELVSK